MTVPRKDLGPKIVVAFLNGDRLKGYSFNFSPVKDSFDMFAQEDSGQHRGTKVDLKEVKAVFFAKDFAGDPKYQESVVVAGQPMGRKMEVTFGDGEKLVGITQAYHPQQLGFFIVPIDPQSNNARIFVINRNAHEIKRA
jgi:hypothetical protein